MTREVYGRHVRCLFFFLILVLGAIGRGSSYKTSPVHAQNVNERLDTPQQVEFTNREITFVVEQLAQRIGCSAIVGLSTYTEVPRVTVSGSSVREALDNLAQQLEASWRQEGKVLTFALRPRLPTAKTTEKEKDWQPVVDFLHSFTETQKERLRHGKPLRLEELSSKQSRQLEEAFDVAVSPGAYKVVTQRMKDASFVTLRIIFIPGIRFQVGQETTRVNLFEYLLGAEGYDKWFYIVQDENGQLAPYDFEQVLKEALKK